MRDWRQSESSDDSGTAIGTETPQAGTGPPLTRRNVPMMLLVARECIVARFRPLLTSHGLTEQQWRILRFVYASGPIEQREIVIACGISAPSLAGILARMEVLDLVTRVRPAHDQRLLQVSLTERSQTLVASIAPRIEAIYRKIEEEIDPAVLGTLIDSLEIILAALDAPPDPHH